VPDDPFAPWLSGWPGFAVSGPDELENEPGLALPAVGGTVVESLADPFAGRGFDGE
jgi:hypothetical protein